MQREIIHITRVMTIIALFMGLVFFVLGLSFGKGTLIASIFALSLIVANVPEGLLPTITLSLSLASQRMARRQALIKNLDSVETLGSATVICTDKTGTLTRNEMTAKSILLAGGEEVTISGEGYRERCRPARSPAHRQPPELPRQHRPGCPARRSDRTRPGCGGPQKRACIADPDGKNPRKHLHQ